MKISIRLFVAIIAVVGASYFIVYAFVTSSPPPKVALPPDLSRSPARVYGVIEPAGREVFVSPPVTKQVVKIFVNEGDEIKKGQILCLLENDVESAELQLALSRVESARKALLISVDEKKRKKNLYSINVNSEYEYTKAQLKENLDESNLKVAQKEVALAKAKLEQLALKSPIDGAVYKLDIRLGETLSAGDNSRIILGSPDLWVRLFVEAFWINRVTIGSQYKVFNSETNEFLGTGKVVYVAPYMGRRNFRTEDLQERFDTKFREVVLVIDTKNQNIPLGLSVVVELIKE